MDEQKAKRTQKARLSPGVFYYIIRKRKIPIYIRKRRTVMWGKDFKRVSVSVSRAKRRGELGETCDPYTIYRG